MMRKRLFWFRSLLAAGVCILATMGPLKLFSAGLNDKAVADSAAALHLLRQGEHYKHFSRYDSAKSYLQLAYDQYTWLCKSGADTRTWTERLRTQALLGEVNRLLGNVGAADTLLSSAVQLAESEFGKGSVQSALPLNYLGAALRKDERFIQAINYVNKAVQILKDNEQGTSLDLAECYNNLGGIYYYWDKSELAEEYWSKALELRRQILGENHVLLASGYNNLGLILRNSGEYAQAIKMFERALAVKLEALGERNPSTANTYLNLGLIYKFQGDYEKELIYNQQVLSIRKEVYGQNHNDVAGAYNNLGTVHSRLHNFEAAEACYDSALAILERINDSSNRATILLNQGDLYRETHDYPQALVSLQEALKLRKDKLEGDAPLVASVYEQLAPVYALLKDTVRARLYYDSTLSIRAKSWGNAHPRISAVHTEIAKLDLAQHKYTRALKSSQRALESLNLSTDVQNIGLPVQVKDNSDLTFLFPALLSRAEALEAVGSRSPEISHKIEALKTYTLAAYTSIEIQNRFANEGSKLRISDSNFEVFAAGVRLALELFTLIGDTAYFENAWEIAELGNASVLRQALREAEAITFAGVSDSLVRIERRLSTTRNSLRTRLDKAEQGDASEPVINKLKNRLFEISRQHDLVLEEIEQSNPEYYQLKHEIAIVTAEEVQQALPDGTLLLKYFSDRDKLYIFGLRRDSAAVNIAPIPDDFGDLVRSFALAVRRPGSQDSRLMELGTTLYDIVLAPVANQLTGIRQLTVIPDGDLNSLPFAALIHDTNHYVNADKSGRFLIEDFELSYHYSASLFKGALKKEVNQSHRTEKLFMGYAPLFLPPEDPGLLDLLWQNLSSAVETLDSLARYSLKTRDGNNLDPLPFTKAELESIQAILGSDYEQKIFLGAGANEKQLRLSANKAGILHIASHGRYDANYPRLSGIALYPPASESDLDDGFLYIGETYNLNLNADLVVLSACESGLGELVQGEGMIALTRGFLYAGARNVVASKWRVSDQSTSEMMKEFYRQIAAGKSYTAALRTAQLELLNNTPFQHPYFWAAFSLVGQ